MKNKFENFGKELRKLRQARGLTQQQLGQSVGVHSQYISNCERFKCALPKKNVKRFVKALKLTSTERSSIMMALVDDQVKNTRFEWSSVLGV